MTAYAQYFKNLQILPEPQSLPELQERLELIKGHTIADLAAAISQPLPPDSAAGKGYCGELIELYLGASSGNLAQPDFPNLGIELKTMPIDRHFEPLQTTFVCHAALRGVRGETFEDSVLYHKLRLTLYVFILSEKQLSLPKRRVIDYCLHPLQGEDLQIIKTDYEELMELIAAGQAQSITARMGTYLQMRPKAADGRQLTECIDADGKVSFTRPRGFYLRRSYNQHICALVATRHQLPLEVQLET